MIHLSIRSCTTEDSFGHTFADYREGPTYEGELDGVAYSMPTGFESCLRCGYEAGVEYIFDDEELREHFEERKSDHDAYIMATTRYLSADGSDCTSCDHLAKAAEDNGVNVHSTCHRYECGLYEEWCEDDGDTLCAVKAGCNCLLCEG